MSDPFETDQKRRDTMLRRSRSCRKCGSTDTYDATGSQCGGLIGIMYKVCGACGEARAITKRQRRVTLSNRPKKQTEFERKTAELLADFRFFSDIDNKTSDEEFARSIFECDIKDVFAYRDNKVEDIIDQYMKHTGIDDWDTAYHEMLDKA